MPRYIIEPETEVTVNFNGNIVTNPPNGTSFISFNKELVNHSERRSNFAKTVSFLTEKDEATSLTLTENLTAKEISYTFSKLYDIANRKYGYQNGKTEEMKALVEKALDVDPLSRLDTRTAQQFEDNFISKHKRYFIPINTLTKFVQMSKDLLTAYETITHNTNFKLAFRLYIGHNNVRPEDRIYSIVIVPIATLKIFTNPVARHTQDKEVSLFQGAGKLFFALVLTVSGNTTSIEIKECTEDGSPCLNIIGQCKSLLEHTDENGPTLIFHTHEDLENFMVGLDPNAIQDSLEIQFGRNESGKLVAILTFFDADGDTILSSFNVANFTGICFDKGDLLPPPPLVDSFFIP